MYNAQRIACVYFISISMHLVGAAMHISMYVLTVLNWWKHTYKQRKKKEGLTFSTYAKPAELADLAGCNNCE